MNLVTGTHEDANGRAIAEWFGCQIGRCQYPPYVALGWVDDRGIRSAALFNDFTGANLEIHIVGRLTANRLSDAYRYAFVRAGVLRLTAKPKRSNRSLTKLLPRLGFKFEAEMKNYYGPSREDDALVFRLDRADAEKWII